MGTTDIGPRKSLPKGRAQKTSVLLRLERNQREAGILRKKLNSYICEPQTYFRFERIENLKTGLERFALINENMLTTLREQRKSIEELKDKVKAQLRDFDELQRGVDDYVRGLNPLT